MPNVIKRVNRKESDSGIDYIVDGFAIEHEHTKPHPFTGECEECGMQLRIEGEEA